METTNKINYDNFAEKHLGEDHISTWLDSKNKEKAAIALLIDNHLGKEEIIDKADDPEGYGMDLILFKINDMPVVFLYGQPDSIYYRKNDHEKLLKLTK